MTEATRRSVRKYRQTAKGKAAAKRINARRIIFNNRCIGYAKTADERRAIQAHIKRRRREFREQTCSVEIPDRSGSSKPFDGRSSV